jgi:hypothetical protein
MRDKSDLGPCVTCNKPDCGTTVMLSVMGSKKKQFSRTMDCLDLIFPTCSRPFAISIFKLEWFEVNEQDLGKGFSGGSYASISRCRVQSPQSRRHFQPVREGALTGPAGLQQRVAHELEDIVPRLRSECPEVRSNGNYDYFRN